MKFLIDTNVLIPLEPTAPEQVEAMTEPALGLLRSIEEAGYQLFIHPDMRADIDRDPRDARRRLREMLLKKYLPLPVAPQVPEDWELRLGRPAVGTNDWVDHRLLAAVCANAVSVLVTEDRRIHKKAERVGLRHRVATIGDALALVQGLRARFAQPPPAVEFTYAYNIDVDDPLFDGLREDYGGVKFDIWLRGCQAEHRRCWVVRAEGRRLAAICLIKDEEKELGLEGKILKLCTFGNGLRKAYLCKAPIRQIGPGAPLFFYLSHSKKAVTVVGVAEEAFVSRDVEEIASTVGKRTVYSMRDIEDFCSGGEVLAILFRQAMSVEPKPITLAELIQNGVLRAAPQSIVTVQQGGSEWLRQRLGL